MTENQYQAKLVRTLKRTFPRCVILKNDSGYQQGMSDLTIFFGPRWAALEVKVEENAKEQPNQRYFVNQLNAMSFAAFIYPENEEEVLRALEQFFEGDS